MVRLAEVLEALPSAALWKKAVPTISSRLVPTLLKIRNRFKKIKTPGDRMVNAWRYGDTNGPAMSFFGRQPSSTLSSKPPQTKAEHRSPPDQPIP